MDQWHDTWDKLCPPWWIFKKGGYGVHSPFVFDLITKVIEEKQPYYRYDDIELVYKDFLFREELIVAPDPHDPSRTFRRPIAEIMMNYATRKKLGQLLFRLTNYFKIHDVIQIGSGAGMSTLYLTSYAKEVHDTVLEKDYWVAHVAEEVNDKGARSPVDLRNGDYLTLLRELTGRTEGADLIFFDARDERHRYPELIEEALKMVHDKSVFVFEDIRADRQTKEFWMRATQLNDVSAALDLWSVGIHLFDAHLHRRYYKVYF